MATADSFLDEKQSADDFLGRSADSFLDEGEKPDSFNPQDINSPNRSREDSIVGAPIIPESLIKKAIDINPVYHLPFPESVKQFGSGVRESVASGLSGMTMPEEVLKLPAFAIPVVGEGLAALLGGKSIGAGARKMAEASTPQEAGAGFGEAAMGASMVLPAGIHAAKRGAIPAEVKPVIEAAKESGLSKAADAVEQSVSKASEPVQAVEPVEAVPTVKESLTVDSAPVLEKDTSGMPDDFQLRRIQDLEKNVQDALHKAGDESPETTLLSLTEGKNVTHEEYESGLVKLLARLKSLGKTISPVVEPAKVETPKAPTSTPAEVPAEPVAESEKTTNPDPVNEVQAKEVGQQARALKSTDEAREFGYQNRSPEQVTALRIEQVKAQAEIDAVKTQMRAATDPKEKLALLGKLSEMTKPKQMIEEALHIASDAYHDRPSDVEWMKERMAKDAPTDTASPTAEQPANATETASAPDAPQGTVRLYRGEDSASGGGVHWTTDPNYAASQGSKVSYVDLPKVEADAANQRARATGNGTAANHILTPEQTKAAQPADWVKAAEATPLTGKKTLAQLGRDLPGAGESGGVQLPIDAIADRLRKVRDYVTIDPIPRLTRAMGGDIGTGNNSAIQHAAARTAVPRMVDDLLAKVFPDQYKDPKAMQKTMEILNKDNILGGYDSFIQKSVDAQNAGHDSAAAHWRKMAKDVADAHDLAGYEQDVRAAQADPAVADNIKRWNAEVNPTLDKLYNEMKGMDADTPREGRGKIFGARVNLLPKAEEGRWIDALNDEEKPIPSPSSSNYRNPNVKRDKFDRRAKFTGEYSDNPAAVLANVLAHRWNEVTKIRFLNDLVRSGAGSWEKPDSGLIHGEEAKSLPVKMPETKTEMVDGIPVDSATRQVERTIWVPQDTVSDIRGILDTDLRMKQNPVAKALTALQIAQLADAFTHTKNLHSVIANAQGTKALWSDVARKMPLLSTADSAVRITKVLYDIAQDTPEIRAEMAEMAKNGMLRQHFPATGIQKVTKMQDMIHHVDTAARVIMNRFYDNLVDRGLAVDTMPARRKFVQQVGEYNKRLMGPMMQTASRSGLSPFIVAGRNFNRFGRRLLTGNPGFESTGPKEELQARLVNFTTLGAMFVLPMMVNQVLTGSIWGRKGTPLGAIDLNQPVDEKGNHRVLDLASLYGARRGMRATGVESIVEGLRAGKSPDDIVGGAIHNAVATAAHPWMGPALGAAYSTVTGQRLDLRGGPTPVEARKVGDKTSASQLAENARVALKNQNALLYSPFRPLFKDTEESFGKDLAKDFLKAPGQSVGLRDVKSPALQKAGELMGSYQQTPEQAEKAQVKREAVKSLHEGDKTKLKEAQASKTLNQRDAADVRQRAKDPLVFMVKKLGAEDSVKVWKLADEQERKTLKAIINQKIVNSTTLDPKEKRRLREELGTLKPIGQ